VFALVALGLFDAALYYRLNVFLLRVGPARSFGSQERHVPRARAAERMAAVVNHG
jgi:transcriptional regulator of aromatic amino acid metabolism